MAENKKNEKDETPKMKVLDRRHWVDETEDSNSDDIPNKPIEERLPNFVEQLKKDAEDKDKRLREYISAYKGKNAENDLESDCKKKTKPGLINSKLFFLPDCYQSLITCNELLNQPHRQKI